MKITWQVDDGHTNAAEFVTYIDDEELADYSDEDARERFIADYIDEEFRQTVSWSIVKREPS